MPFSNAQNEMDMFLLFSMANPAQLVNVAASATVVNRFRVPLACTIVRLDAVYETEAGTGPSLTVTVNRGSTVLFSSACTTDATMVSDTVVASGESADADAGEALTVVFTSANADNDFTGISIQVWARRKPN